MGTNRTEDGYLFSVNFVDGRYDVDLKDASLEDLFADSGAAAGDVTAAYVTENEVEVHVPEEISNSVIKRSGSTCSGGDPQLCHRV